MWKWKVIAWWLRCWITDEKLVSLNPRALKLPLLSLCSRTVNPELFGIVFFAHLL